MYANWYSTKQFSIFASTANTGALLPTARFKPYNYFAFLISDNLTDWFSVETNRYVKELIDTSNLSRPSCENIDWCDRPKRVSWFAFCQGNIH